MYGGCLRAASYSPAGVPRRRELGVGPSGRIGARNLEKILVSRPETALRHIHVLLSI